MTQKAVKDQALTKRRNHMKRGWDYVLFVYHSNNLLIKMLSILSFKKEKLHNKNLIIKKMVSTL